MAWYDMQVYGKEKQAELIQAAERARRAREGANSTRLEGLRLAMDERLGEFLRRLRGAVRDLLGCPNSLTGCLDAE
ncbi:hypothetical protein [Salinispira pacifica]